MQPCKENYTTLKTRRLSRGRREGTALSLRSTKLTPDLWHGGPSKKFPQILTDEVRAIIPSSKLTGPLQYGTLCLKEAGLSCDRPN
jgi:hypothetical protein